MNICVVRRAHMSLKFKRTKHGLIINSILSFIKIHFNSFPCELRSPVGHSRWTMGEWFFPTCSEPEKKVFDQTSKHAAWLNRNYLRWIFKKSHFYHLKVLKNLPVNSSHDPINVGSLSQNKAPWEERVSLTARCLMNSSPGSCARCLFYLNILLSLRIKACLLGWQETR